LPVTIPEANRSKGLFRQVATCARARENYLQLVAPMVLSALQSSILMSQHRSLKGASTIQTKRNVLKRFERVELLKKRGVFKPGDRVIGLPKTKPDA
jgi:small basic protein (TIGR04137 family)